MEYGNWSDLIADIAKDAPEGDFVECGTYVGNSARVLAPLCKGTLHLFDSWEGISELDESDGEYYKTEKWLCKLEDAQLHLSSYKNIEFHKGWFPERFDDVVQPISLLHIDASLYRPTMLSLRHFWPLLKTGGFAICNSHSGYASGAEKAVREFFGDIKITTYPMGVMLIIKN